MPQKVFVYAKPHDDKGNDKILVIKEPAREVFTLPQADVPVDKYPEWVVYEVLESQTGLGAYPDIRNSPGVLTSRDHDFIRLPQLEGKLLFGDVEILCYSVEVNERRQPTGDAIWLPWWSLRWDDRTSTMMRFVMALLYAGISGWEMKLDEQGNWTLPYLCTEGRKNHTVDEILSGEIKMQVYDSFHDIIRKGSDRWMKLDKKEPENSPSGNTWLLRLMRRLGMIG